MKRSRACAAFLGLCVVSAAPADQDAVLHLGNAVGEGRELDVYVRTEGGRCAGAFGRAPSWNKASHAVDVSAIAAEGTRIAGELVVQLQPDAWTPKDGRPITGRYRLSADLATGRGSYAGMVGSDSRTGTVEAAALPPTAYLPETGEIELELHNAVDADKEWRRIAAVTLTGAPGAGQRGKVTTELHRRGGVLLDTDSACVTVSNGIVRGDIVFTVPPTNAAMPATIFAIRIEGREAGGRLGGTLERRKTGGPATAVTGFFHGALFARPRPLREIVYKRTETLDLRALVNLPTDWRPTDRRPAMLYFSGGAWRIGSMNQFRPHAYYLAERGMVVVRADYRVLPEGRTMSNIDEDPRSALRWLVDHAGELGVDPERIVVAGQSAGGQLAAMTAWGDEADMQGGAKALPARAAALVLISSVVDMTPETTGGDAELARRISPLAQLRGGLPPTLIVVGTSDFFVKQNREFAARSRALGNRLDLYAQEKGDHGFALVSPGMEKTCRRLDMFLASLGFLTGAPTIEARGEPLAPEPGQN